jgi:hypothetical protein
MELVPTWARQHVFENGLNRPKEFIEYYSSIESLLKRSVLYTKRSKKPEERRSLSTKRVLMAVPFKEAPEGLKVAVQLSNYPFDSAQDVLIYYKGIKGKEIYCLVEKDFYDTMVNVLDGHGKGLNMDGRGYLYIGNLGVHRMVLGLGIGDFARNGLLGCHKVPGLFGKWDNRKRVLKVGSAAENTADQSIAYYV